MGTGVNYSARAKPGEGSLLAAPKRTTLSRVPLAGSLQCPVCPVWTTKQGTQALRQLSTHVTKTHPFYVWTRRYCNGPTHDRPTLMPLDRFNRRGGRADWRRECRKCEEHARNLRLGNAGYVRASRLVAYADALVARHGSVVKAAAVIGVPHSELYYIVRRERQFLQRRTAARILRAAA